MKAPTQADVARIANVSRATVSYVLNGRSGGAISVAEDTRQRILSAAEQLGYEPNASAQSLRLKSTKSIGFTIFDQANPHNWQIVHGADEEARACGYKLLLISTTMDLERERASTRELLRHRIDGLVLSQTHRDQMIEEFKALIRRQSAVVLLGSYGTHPPELDTVTPGHAAGAAQLMKHLLELGHRRIGFVFGVAAEPLGCERMAAYRKQLQQCGIPVDESLIKRCGVTIADGYRAALDLLSRGACEARPTAILVINDLLAIGVLHAASELGLRVPADVSVAGFDDIEMAPYLNPALTTIRVNAEEVGRAAVRLILERVSDPERPPQHVHVAARLVQRESTGPAPQD
jgi:LacI family transcriptional regulator